MTDSLEGLPVGLRKAAFCLSCGMPSAKHTPALHQPNSVLPAGLVAQELRQIKEEVLSIESDNPYPADIFPDRGLTKKAADLLYANGISPDNVFGNWGRKMWQNCCDKVKEKVEEAFG